MKMFINLIISIMFAQVVLGQITIPLKRNCGYLEIPSTSKSNFVVTNNAAYPNLLQQLAGGNIGGLSASNGLPVINLPVTNAILDAVQAKIPTANNVQVSLGQLPVCQENQASVVITPNNPGLNLGGIANYANGGLGNIGLQFVPKSSTINVPIRFGRNIQKNNLFL